MSTAPASEQQRAVSKAAVVAVLKAAGFVHRRGFGSPGFFAGQTGPDVVSIEWRTGGTGDYRPVVGVLRALEAAGWETRALTTGDVQVRPAGHAWEGWEYDADRLERYCRIADAEHWAGMMRKAADQAEARVREAEAALAALREEAGEAAGEAVEGNGTRV